MALPSRMVYCMATTAGSPLRTSAGATPLQGPYLAAAELGGQARGFQRPGSLVVAGQDQPAAALECAGSLAHLPLQLAVAGEVEDLGVVDESLFELLERPGPEVAGVDALHAVQSVPQVELFAVQVELRPRRIGVGASSRTSKRTREIRRSRTRKPSGPLRPAGISGGAT